ncbi:MAG: KpsF/GutQ family sugar-phosphate isomerase [Hydrogenophilales bacterium]
MKNLNTFFNVLAKEADEIQLKIKDFKKNQVQNIDHSINAILKCKGKLIVCGIGKSGHIGRKIASTFASTGTPAFYIHPAEASHGDLGMIDSRDLVLCISYSGETEEITQILPIIKKTKAKIISITGNPHSTLAQLSNFYIDINVSREACPLNLAPTSSTTLTLAVGDAIAMSVMVKKKFNSNNFAQSHPGGSLGRRLIYTVEDIMLKGDSLPLVSVNSLLKDVLYEISEKRMGMAIIIDGKKNLQGIFTDGDLRRILETTSINFDSKISRFMKKNPLTIEPDKNISDAISLLNTKKINQLVVLNKNKKVIGALSIHTLLEKGFI